MALTSQQPDPPSPAHHTRGLIAVGLANLIWSSAYSATAVALRVVSPMLLTAGRLTLAALVLLPFLAKPGGRRWTRRELWHALFLGVIGFTLPVFLQTAGQSLSNAAMAALSVALEPLATVLLAALVARERLQPRAQVALGIALVGAWTVSGMPRPGNLGQAPGDLLLLLSVACYGAYTVLSADFAKQIPPLTATALVMLTGALTAIPLWGLSGHSWPEVWPPAVIGALVYVGVFGTAGAYLLWMVGVARVPLQVVALSLYLQPVLGVVFALVLLGLHPHWSFYLGAGLIALALLVFRPDRVLMAASESSSSAS
jgi:drug/metabolite transporter (DMT)-like permease